MSENSNQLPHPEIDNPAVEQRADIVISKPANAPTNGFGSLQNAISTLCDIDPSYLGGVTPSTFLASWSASMSEQLNELRKENLKFKKDNELLRKNDVEQQIEIAKLESKLSNAEGVKKLSNLISLFGFSILGFGLNTYENEAFRTYSIIMIILGGILVIASMFMSRIFNYLSGNSK